MFYFVISCFHCFCWLLFRVNRLHCVVVCLSFFETFYFNWLPHRLIDYRLCVCGVMVQGFLFLIDYYIILIDYMLGLKLFLVFCFVVIDYSFILIDYMLWFLAFFGFVFFFNRLFYVLLYYKGLKESFTGIFNRLHLHFNWILLSTFGFWWK